MKLKTIITFFFVFFYSLCYSQNTARIYVTMGSRVPFIFESYHDIANGKTLGSGSTGFTKIEAYFKHTVNPSTWQLDVKANNAVFTPDFGTTSIPINKMTMDVYLDGVLTGNYTLTTADQTIATLTGDYTVGVTHIITITYHFAEPAGLINMQSDNFSNDLLFTLHN